MINKLTYGQQKALDNKDITWRENGQWWSDWNQRWMEEDEQDTYFCDVCGMDYTLEDPCEFH
jgi:hypothetical protein